MRIDVNNLWISCFRSFSLCYLKMVFFFTFSHLLYVMRSPVFSFDMGTLIVHFSPVGMNLINMSYMYLIIIRDIMDLVSCRNMVYIYHWPRFIETKPIAFNFP